MYTLKQIAQRGTAWGGVAAFVVAAVAPLTTPAFADSLNPLTDRSLTLSSSAPGWENYDGSGNPTYAQPNSGANGQKTGNTFDFKVSSAETIKGMTFQYCTTSAGECRAPGDNAVHGTDVTGSTSDLKVVTDSPAEVATGDFGTVVDTTNGVIKAVPGFTDPAINSTPDTTGQYAAHAVDGNFVVFVKTGPSAWAQSDGWTMTASNKESSTQAAPDDNTGQNNYITLANNGGEALTFGQQVKVVFFGTDDNYIQNPGSGAFFVKINTYSDEAATTVVDGGVTVANVMNNSIRIQTKVLETMQFSVGTVDPNTLSSADGVEDDTTSTYEKSQGVTDATAPYTAKPHGVCDTIATGMTPTDAVNVLSMGNKSGENSLEVDQAYATHSYWRLSSNSSAGATVYYSGVTLSNTVGDKIAAIGPTSSSSAPGNEQFGLAMTLADNTAAADESAPYPGDTATQLFTTNYDSLATFEQGADDNAPGVHASISDVSSNASYHTPRLYPLVPETNYKDGRGTLTAGGTAKFAFDETSNSIPVALATESSQVVDCVTARMRYVANIAATTPAGIYTTAVNYIAAPQY